MSSNKVDVCNVAWQQNSPQARTHVEPSTLDVLLTGASCRAASGKKEACPPHTLLRDDLQSVQGGNFGRSLDARHVKADVGDWRYRLAPIPWRPKFRRKL